MTVVTESSECINKFAGFREANRGPCAIEAGFAKIAAEQAKPGRRSPSRLHPEPLPGGVEEHAQRVFARLDGVGFRISSKMLFRVG